MANGDPLAGLVKEARDDVRDLRNLILDPERGVFARMTRMETRMGIADSRDTALAHAQEKSKEAGLLFWAKLMALITAASGIVEVLARVIVQQLGG